MIEQDLEILTSKNSSVRTSYCVSLVRICQEMEPKIIAKKDIF